MTRIQALAPVLICGIALAAGFVSRAAADDALPSPEHSSPQQFSSSAYLAGGALPICSDLGLSSCSTPPADSAQARQAASYSVSTESLQRIDFTASSDSSHHPALAALASVLRNAAERHPATPLSIDTLMDLLFSLCHSASRDRVRRCRGEQTSPWSKLDDGERAAVLSALELPQLDGAGERRRERVFVSLTTPEPGLEVLRAFVADAARRGGARARIAVVTASAQDPMEPVDFYLSLFSALGADAEWWPLDASLARAIEAGDDCTKLDARRLQVLQLSRRRQVYPDLDAQQVAACTDPSALASTPMRIDGVFFAGGDQWRLRQAFFDSRDTPLPWLVSLRRQYANGELVVAGTSAGAAVQSGAAMLSNGSPLSAMLQPGVAGAPPAPGCGRDNRCPAGIEEDRLSFWPAGGLGLIAEGIVDTHFSERAREPRLLRLLAQTGARYGFGVDEASALHVQSTPQGAQSVSAIGASGGWVFERTVPMGDDLQAQVHYLAPGALLELSGEGLTGASSVDCLDPPLAPPDPAPDQDALQAGALRAAARALANCGTTAVELPAEASIVRLERLPHSRVVAGPRGPSIGPLRLSAKPVAARNEASD